MADSKHDKFKDKDVKDVKETEAKDAEEAKADVKDTKEEKKAKDAKETEADAASASVSDSASASPAESPATETAAAATTEVAAPAAPTAEAETHPDPNVAVLRGMFPTVDVSVIEMVLESVGGSQERAIEHLLPMTDPEFKPDPASEANATSQLTMDEELARALYIHEQELATRPSARRSASSSDSASRIPAVLPYQARVRRPRPAQPDPYAQSTREHALSERYGDPPEGQGPGGDPPGMIAFEEKLGQFAEAGKQTFNSFLTRAKAKYSELQEHHATRKAEQLEIADDWRQQGAAEGPIIGAHERKKYGGLWGATPVDGSGGSGAGAGAGAASGAAAGASAGISSSRRWSPSDAYDDPSSDRSMSPILRSPGPGSGAASPEKVNPGKIDLSKLGFLPKKKVDLMSAATSPGDKSDTSGAAPTTPQTTKSTLDQIPKTPPAEMSPHTLGDSDDDDDDLEYTENPFDKK